MEENKTWVPISGWSSMFLLVIFFLLGSSFLQANEVHLGPLVTKEQMTTVVQTDNGVISAVDVDDGYRGPYHVEFISLEPDSLLLPVLLHTDMVFYVQSGKGTVSWITEDETNHMDVERGDIYRIEMGSVFYIKSQPDPMREKLRVNALFGSMRDEKTVETYIGGYSNLTDLIRGFDEEVLQMGFRDSEEAIASLKSAEKPPAIIPYPHKNETEIPEYLEWEEEILEVLISGRSLQLTNKKKKKKKSESKAFNIVKEKPDVENCYGWSTAVTKKDLHALKGSNVGVFMVNLTKGSMMGPHWNPMASEITIVTHGEGMVQIVFPGLTLNDEQRSTRFRVQPGDIFVVPRCHPMAQMSFNNDSLAFMGFSTMAKKNHPQYLAGSTSVFQVLDKEILALSFNVPNATIDELFASKDEVIMLDCTSCAEEAERRMEEEFERKRQEEEARKREEEARRREEERRRQEEEEKRREEEEEREMQEEEERHRQEEEERRRQEEEEERQRQEEEERRRQEEEEERQRQEEEERRRQEKEEEKQRQEEEEERQRQEEEEEERRRQEEEEIRLEEEEEAKRQEEEEEERQRQQDEKERHRQQEEEERQRQEEEDEARRREERPREEEEEEEEWGSEEEEEEETRRREGEWRRKVNFLRRSLRV